MSYIFERGQSISGSQATCDRESVIQQNSGGWGSPPMPLINRDIQPIIVAQWVLEFRTAKPEGPYAVWTPLDWTTKVHVEQDSLHRTVSNRVPFWSGEKYAKKVDAIHDKDFIGSLSSKNGGLAWREINSIDR